MGDSLKHIAFILDGNRRWAKRNGKSIIAGHIAGYRSAKSLVKYLPKYGVRYATFYAFSTENWNRSEKEVKSLFKLFRFFSESLDFFAENNIRIKIIGNLSRFPDDIVCKLNTLQEMTENNCQLTVVCAVGYGGRDELVRTIKQISADVKNGIVSEDDISEKLVDSYLDTAGIPNPDAIVRTSEKRISNFLLWQVAYSEMFFLDKLWPDFNEDDLRTIINEFSQRKRRYGK